MGRRTVLDAFNAAAGFAGAALSGFDRENRNLAEIESRKDSLRLMNDWSEFQRKLDTTGDDDDLMGLFDDFQKQWRAENIDKPAAKGGIRATGFYRRENGNMIDRSFARMEDEVRGIETQRGLRNGRAHYIDAIEEARKAHADDPKGLMEEIDGLTRAALRGNYISYPESKKLRRDIYETAMNGMVDKALQAAMAAGEITSDGEIDAFVRKYIEDLDWTQHGYSECSPINSEGVIRYMEGLEARVADGMPLEPEDRAFWEGWKAAERGEAEYPRRPRREAAAEAEAEPAAAGGGSGRRRSITELRERLWDWETNAPPREAEEAFIDEDGDGAGGEGDAEEAGGNLPWWAKKKEELTDEDAEELAAYVIKRYGLGGFTEAAEKADRDALKKWERKNKGSLNPRREMLYDPGVLLETLLRGEITGKEDFGKALDEGVFPLYWTSGDVLKLAKYAADTYLRDWENKEAKPAAGKKRRDGNAAGKPDERKEAETAPASGPERAGESPRGAAEAAGGPEPGAETGGPPDTDDPLDEIRRQGYEAFKGGETEFRRKTEGYESRHGLPDERFKKALERSSIDRGREEWNGHVKGKWKETDAQLSRKYTAAHAAWRNGDANAVRLIKEGLDEVTKWPDPWINPDDRNKYTKWYGEMLEDIRRPARGSGGAGGSGGSGGGISESDIRKLIERTRAEMLKPGGFHGDNTYEENAENFRDKFFDLARGFGYDVANEEQKNRWMYNFGIEAGLDRFEADLEGIIHKLYPDIKERVMPSLKGFIADIGRGRLNNEQQADLCWQIAGAMRDFVGDMGMGNMTEEDLLNRAKGVAQMAITSRMYMEGQVKNTAGGGSKAKMIEMYEQAYANPWGVTRSFGKESYVGAKENYDAIKTAAVRDISLVKGVAGRQGASVTFHDWLTDPENPDDVLPVPVIAVAGAGKDDGLYVQEVVKTTDRRGRVTKELVTRKLSGEEASRLSGQEAASERERQARDERTAERYKNDAKAEVDALLAAETDWERQNLIAGFDRRHPEPEGHRTAYTYFEDELYLRGLNPETLKPLLAISRERYDELLRRHPEQESHIKKTLRGLLPPRERR